MAVYTDLTPEQIEDLLRRFFVGDLKHFAGISEGVENSNFQLVTDSGEYILTLFETRGLRELDYAQALLLAAQECGLPVAAPMLGEGGAYRVEVAGKPAALSPCLPGEHPQRPDPGQVHQIGAFLGQMHALSPGASHPDLSFDLNPAEQRALLLRLDGYVSQDQSRLLDQGIRELEQTELSALPCGPVHGDLFRDNSLFHKGQLTGVLDFGAAHHGVLLYDLAIAVTDWCVEEGRLQNSGIAVLLEGYEGHRPLSEQERVLWPAMLRLATLRFWLSRLRDWHFPRAGSLVQPKDPAEYERIYLNLLT